MKINSSGRLGIIYLLLAFLILSAVSCSNNTTDSSSQEQQTNISQPSNTTNTSNTTNSSSSESGTGTGSNIISQIENQIADNNSDDSSTVDQKEKKAFKGKFSISMTLGLGFSFIFLVVNTLFVCLNEKKSNEKDRIIDLIEKDGFELDQEVSLDHSDDHIVIIRGRLSAQTLLKDKEMGLEFPDDSYLIRICQTLQPDYDMEQGYGADHNIQWTTKKPQDLRHSARINYEITPKKVIFSGMKIGQHNLRDESVYLMKDLLEPKELSYLEVDYNNLIEPVQKYLQKRDLRMEISPCQQAIRLCTFSQRDEEGDQRILYKKIAQPKVTVVGQITCGEIGPLDLFDEEAASPSHFQVLKEEDTENRRMQPNPDDLFNDSFSMNPNNIEISDKKVKPSLFSVVCFPCLLFYILNRKQRYFFLVERGQLSKQQIIEKLRSQNHKQRSLMRALLISITLGLSYVVGSYICYIGWIMDHQLLVENFYVCLLVTTVAFAVCSLGCGQTMGQCTQIGIPFLRK